MNEMIERVSKAIQDEKDKCINDGENSNLRIARAVIKAMREPTEEMCMVDTPDMPAGGEAKDVWYAMIDEILK